MKICLHDAAIPYRYLISTVYGASTIDYCLVSDTILSNVCDFCINPFDKVMSNTHHPISIQFRTNVTPLQTVVEMNVVTV